MPEPNHVDIAIEDFRKFQNLGAFECLEFESMYESALFEKMWILARARAIRLDPSHHCELCSKQNPMN